MAAPVLIDTTTRPVDVEAIPWVEFLPGLEVKMLRLGGQEGRYTLMTRFAPGTQLPIHRHFGDVHAYTVSGRWHYLEYDWYAEAGSFVYEPPASTHTLHVPEDNTEPTVVLFTVDKGMVLLDDDGTMVRIEDAQSLNAIWAAYLEQLGIEYPEGVLP